MSVTYVYLQAKEGWQPPNLHSHYAVQSWGQEVVNGVPAIVATCAGLNANMGYKIWFPLTQVRASSGSPTIGSHV